MTENFCDFKNVQCSSYFTITYTLLYYEFHILLQGSKVIDIFQISLCTWCQET